MNKAIMFLKKHNIPYTVQPIAYGLERLVIVCDNFNDYSAIHTTIDLWNRRKQSMKYHVDTHFYTCTIWIYPEDVWQTLTDRKGKLQELTDYFWSLIHNNYSPKEAAELQKQYAIDHNLMQTYNEIYHISE